MRAWLDTLGLNLSPTVIWNAIPYSFVVDWFANVGDCLKQYDSNWLSPYTELGFFVENQKFSFTYKHEILPADSLDPTWCIVAEGEGKHFRRTCGYPPITSLVGSIDDYDLSKMSLSASLLYTSKRR